MSAKKSFLMSGVAGLALALALATGLASCGDDKDTNNTLPNEPGIPSADALGGFELACVNQNGQVQSQQKKSVPFQQQQSCVQQSGGQQKQKFTFVEKKVADFDVVLDCSMGVLAVGNLGEDADTKFLPVGQNGSVQGTLKFLDEVDDDGKGSGKCWILYEVSFSGTAQCAQQAGTVPQPQPTFTILPQPGVSSSPGPTPSATSSPGSSGKLDLTTTITFGSTTLQALDQAGIAGLPMTPQPSPSPSPSPSPRPSPTATATVRPIKVCIVDNPCPIEGKASLSCGE
jgi:hypothetical protein